MPNKKMEKSMLEMSAYKMKSGYNMKSGLQMQMSPILKKCGYKNKGGK